MPLIKNPGKEIQMGKVRIIMGVIGPIIQTPKGNHLPHVHSCHYYTGGRVEEWTYKAGPIKKIEIATEHGEKILWFSWR